MVTCHRNTTFLSIHTLKPGFQNALIAMTRQVNASWFSSSTLISATLVALNYTNRYCARCDILIGHKDEIEHLLTDLFEQINPDCIGNDYLVLGTVEKKAWRENMEDPKPSDEMLHHVHDFKSYQDIRMTQGGWFREDEIQPVVEPRPSEEWVKTHR